MYFVLMLGGFAVWMLVIAGAHAAGASRRRA